MRGMNIEDAAAKGFKRDVSERSLAILEAMALPAETLTVAMDLARYVRIPLDEATYALVMGRKRLRRLGLVVPEGADPIGYVAAETAGQADAYTTTFYGGLDVREAQGHTFTRAFTSMFEQVFGPR
jgi:hypothetical protein